MAMTSVRRPLLKDVAAPKPWNMLWPSRGEAARMVAESAGKKLMLFSGGEMLGEGDVIDKAASPWRPAPLA